MTSKSISLAYSPDTDDAFMIIALKDKLIDLKGYEFQFFRDDIQKLNDQALQGTYDITAISMAAYPRLAEQYFLLPVGSSIGDGYGPVVVCKKDHLIDLENLAHKRVAVPGMQTSAYFSSLHVLPNYQAVPMHFENIIPAILNGEVDAGILIHERQISFADMGLHKLADLGALWQQKYQLPLPLGGNAIHRRLGDVCIQELTELLRESIDFAFRNRETVLDQAVLESQKQDVLPNATAAQRYIDMYVNKDSITFRPEVRQALELMYDKASTAGLCPRIDLNLSIVDMRL